MPEIDAEETGLVAHVLQQVGAALRSEREVRRARDINFRCRGQMLLGTAYPVLAAREGDDWQRKVEPTIGDMVYAEASDYHVTVDAPADVALFASGEATTIQATGESRTTTAREFTGEALRDFAIIAGRGLRSEERVIGETLVRSIFTPEHEIVGRRVLARRLRPCASIPRASARPYKTINVWTPPLVAGLAPAGSQVWQSPALLCEL